MEGMIPGAQTGRMLAMHIVSDAGLDEWAKHIQTPSKQVGQIAVLFNNNSEGDAAKNTNQMIRELNLAFNCLQDS